MGINFTWKQRNTKKKPEPTAQWAYSGFMRFREKVAHHYGITLKDMDGFHGTTKWKNVKAEPSMKRFLNHSDCDGILSPNTCFDLAPILRKVVSNWEDSDYDKQMALLLADNMESCFKAGNPLIFT